MSYLGLTQLLTDAINSLSEQDSVKDMFHLNGDGNPLPSGKVLEEIVDLTRSIIFPGFYGKSSVSSKTIKYHIGVNVERLHKLLSGQIFAGKCFTDNLNSETCGRQGECMSEAEYIAAKLIEQLPALRKVLDTDVVAAYNGDPAAESFCEVISCYPAIKALTNYRVAHELVKLGVPLIPRMLTELAHSETGIDIHPAARIGEYFTIDHGTGVVIGATCIIGNNVKLYQGVTLGAKSFPLDKEGNPIKGIARHPIIEDNVIIYANATVLGRITIGKNSMIGANVWVTEDMQPNTKKYIEDNFN